jgi:hypothetical protein
MGAVHRPTGDHARRGGRTARRRSHCSASASRAPRRRRDPRRCDPAPDTEGHRSRRGPLADGHASASASSGRHADRRWHGHALHAPGKSLISAPEHTTPKRARACLVTDGDVARAVSYTARSSGESDIPSGIKTIQETPIDAPGNAPKRAPLDTLHSSASSRPSRSLTGTSHFA